MSIPLDERTAITIVGPNQRHSSSSNAVVRWTKRPGDGHTTSFTVEDITPLLSMTALSLRQYGKPMALCALLVYSSAYTLDHTV